jgi:predicted nucleotidyltransferase
MPDALDPLPLLRALHERGIEHIVVGGFAVNAHGFIRVTKDLNVVPNPDPRNLGRLAEMLRDLDASILDTDDFVAEEMVVDPARASDLEMGGNFCLLTGLGRLDVMQWLTGIETDDLYGEICRDSVEGSVDGIPVQVCSLEHLRAMKRAAGRPQDLEDLRRLAED